MFKRYELKIICLMVLLTVPLIFSPGLNVYGGAMPEPKTTKVTGTTINAVLIAELRECVSAPGYDCYIYPHSIRWMIVGDCKGTPVSVGPMITGLTTVEAFGATVADDLIYLSWAWDDPCGCYAGYPHPVVLLITKVSSFSNTDEFIGAEISLQIKE